jgi:hypothetical protein
MSALSLKERIDLFKLGKKPRPQIRLRFDTLALALPAALQKPLPLPTFKSHKKEFNQQLHRSGNLRHSTEGEESAKLMRVKNEYFSLKLEREWLRNRKTTGSLLRTLAEKNTKWVMHGGDVN